MAAEKWEGADKRKKQLTQQTLSLWKIQFNVELFIIFPQVLELQRNVMVKNSARKKVYKGVGPE